MKICPVCQQEKRAFDFGMNNLTLDGLMYACKTCRSWLPKNWRRVGVGCRERFLAARACWWPNEPPRTEPDGGDDSEDARIGP